MPTMPKRRLSSFFEAMGAGPLEDAGVSSSYIRGLSALMSDNDAEGFIHAANSITVRQDDASSIDGDGLTKRDSALAWPFASAVHRQVVWHPARPACNEGCWVVASESERKQQPLFRPRHRMLTLLSFWSPPGYV